MASPRRTSTAHGQRRSFDMQMHRDDGAWGSDEDDQFDLDDEVVLEEGRPLSPSRRAPPGGAAAAAAAGEAGCDVPAEDTAEGFDIKERRPDEWMQVKDTMGPRFLPAFLLLQVVAATAGLTYLATAMQGQLSWDTYCWGVWNHLKADNGVQTGQKYVHFDTQLGWKGYGKDGNFGLVSDLSTKVSTAGTLCAAMATFTLLFAFIFGIWALVIMYKSREKRLTAEEAAAERAAELNAEYGDIDGTMCQTCCHRMELAVRSHTMMRMMAYFMVLAGAWLLITGVLAYYVGVQTQFNDNILAVIDTWGANVQCDVPDTAPRFGFFANGINIIVQAGGGAVVLMKVLAATKELKEAVLLWERDQDEIAALEGEKKKRIVWVPRRVSTGDAAAPLSPPTASTSPSDIEMTQRRGSTTSAKGAAATSRDSAKFTHVPRKSAVPRVVSVPMKRGGNKASAVISGLPTGWEVHGEDGANYYVNHARKEVTMHTPR